jgi:hypothetical protein
MSNTELLRLIESQVDAKVLELSTWKKVRWEGGRLYYETTQIGIEISDYDIKTQLFYLECLQSKRYVIQDNLPSSAPDITAEFRHWLTKSIAKLKIKILQEEVGFNEKKTQVTKKEGLQSLIR